MKRWKLAALIASLFIGQLAVPATHAVVVFDSCSGSYADSKVCAATGDDDVIDMTKTVINLLLFGIGIVAIILIIHSGLKYITSRGDPANIKSAKDTLLYAVIGLIVALMAFTIVNFVLERFGGGTP